MQLISETLRIVGGGAGAGIERFSWIRPVFPDHELRVRIEIVAMRLSRSRPSAGLVTYHGTTLNQRSQPVQEFTAKVLMPRRQSPSVDEQRYRRSRLRRN
jgi:acyl dehydratase